MPAQKPYKFAITHRVFNFDAVRECFTFRTSQSKDRCCRAIASRGI